jgi:tRNA-specific 2-thiouridylase
LGISSRDPLYVTDIDPEKNAIIVGNKEDVYRDELIASGLNWIAIEELKRPTRVKARIRYLHKEAEAMVTPLNDDEVYVKFKEPQMAIAPGQAVVFYHGDVVIGAGTIERAREWGDG